MLAARQADAAYGRAALAAGADPLAQQAFGVGKRTALMSFAAAGELDLCEELLQARAEVGRAAPKGRLFHGVSMNFKGF